MLLNALLSSMLSITKESIDSKHEGDAYLGLASFVTRTQKVTSPTSSHFVCSQKCPYEDVKSILS